MEVYGDSESTLLKFDEHSLQFKVIQGYGMDPPIKYLPTRNPSQVFSFAFHNARYVLFVNTNEDKFGIDGDDAHSYVYKYDFDSDHLELKQQLLTFNPVEGN